MGFRFRRSFKLFPGLRLNVGKNGVSLSAGVRGARVAFGGKGVRTTVGIPGSGMSYTHYSRYNSEEFRERIDAMSDGQRKEFLRRLLKMQVQYMVDEKVFGPVTLQRLTDLIAARRVPEMIYIRASEDEDWELIHGGIIRYAERLRIERGVIGFLIGVVLFAAIVITGLCIHFSDHGSGDDPNPFAAATPYPATPASAKQVAAELAAQDAARRQREAVEIARKYASPNRNP